MKKQKYYIYYFALIHIVALLLLFCSGCATQNKSVGLGAAIGAGGGALIGGIADPGKNGEYRTRNVIVGTTLGAMTGMIASNAIHDKMTSEKQAAFKQGQKSAPAAGSGQMPNLSNPKVESRWIEGRTVGNRYIEGHYEYIIIEPARWED